MTAGRPATPRPAVVRPHERTLPNGLRVVVEPRPGREGAAVELVVPLGAVHDPERSLGATALLWEWQDRGAGGRSARARREAFARLGVRHGGAAGRDRSAVSAALLAAALPEALPLLADEVLTPTLDDGEFETARTHALEALASLEDRPAERLDEALNAHAFLPPYDRSAYGSEAGLNDLAPSDVRAHRASGVGPSGSLLAIVGGVDAEQAFELAEAALGGWTGRSLPGPGAPRWAEPRRHDLPGGGEQTQLGWAWPLLPADDPRAEAQALGMAVLSGGMGARLFREVREARGLAYAVDATARAVPGAAWALAHASTTPERAEETLAVVDAELRRLAEGVEADELERARTLLRTRDATRAESSGGRASQLLRDALLLGRARAVGERLDALARPTRADVDAALAAAPCTTPTRVVLAPGGDA